MTRRSARSIEKTLDQLRKICASFPETSERLSHGAPAFFVRDKSPFVMLVNDHHGDGRFAMWCAAPDGAQEALIAADPERFFRPPYVGHRGWIGVRLEHPDWEIVGAMLADAYRRIAPAKLAALMT